MNISLAFRIIIIWAFSILLVSAVFSPEADGASDYNCGNKSNQFCQVKVVGLYDGDTFYVDIPKIHTLFGKRLGIRVLGIDTPELRGGTVETKAQGQLAKYFTKNLLDNAKRVDLKDCVKGKYFRIVCDVWIDNSVNLTQELLKANLGVPYDK